MGEREYIIENITKEEWEILEDNGIDWCPDDMFGTNHDAVIFGEDEYNKAMKLLRRYKETIICENLEQKNMETKIENTSIQKKLHWS